MPSPYQLFKQAADNNGRNLAIGGTVAVGGGVAAHRWFERRGLAGAQASPLDIPAGVTQAALTDHRGRMTDEGAAALKAHFEPHIQGEMHYQNVDSWRHAGYRPSSPHVSDEGLRRGVQAHKSNIFAPMNGNPYVLAHELGHAYKATPLYHQLMNIPRKLVLPTTLAAIAMPNRYTTAAHLAATLPTLAEEIRASVRGYQGVKAVMGHAAARKAILPMGLGLATYGLNVAAPWILPPVIKKVAPAVGRAVLPYAQQAAYAGVKGVGNLAAAGAKRSGVGGAQVAQALWNRLRSV